MSNNNNDTQDHPNVPSVDEAGATPVEPEDTSPDNIVEPFDPAKIRIETKPLSLDNLIKRIMDDRVDLSPAFQREAGLWSDAAKSRLIESLLVRIPIPAFYFDATDEDRWLVVDGLQRMTALRRFVVAGDLALSELEFLRQFESLKFAQLPRSMQRRIEETQVIVYLIQTGTPEDVKFTVFKRINTGGLPLSPQEIRHALNQGPAIEMLRALAASQEFVEATSGGIRNQRMTDRECALRFLAFATVSYREYKSQDLDGFLNSQMRALNKMSDAERQALSLRFLRAMKAAQRVFGRDAFRKRYEASAPRKPINKALFEAWSVALDGCTDEELQLLEERKALLVDRFMRIMDDRDFDRAVTQGTGDVNKVRMRFETVETLVRGVLQ